MVLVQIILEWYSVTYEMAANVLGQNIHILGI